MKNFHGSVTGPGWHRYKISWDGTKWL